MATTTPLGTMETLLLVPALIVMIFGTIAAVLPVVPGPALVWFAAIIYALATNFRVVGVIPIVILTLLMILGSTTNLWMAALGVKVTGGSFWGVLGGMLGMLVGTVIFFPIGAIVGAVAGTLSAEFVHTRNGKQAVAAGSGTLIGYLLGVVAEGVIALAMTIIFVISLLLAHPAI
ncbi:MAG: DUF456 domain-containing protein [Chloroflexota bacterium]